MLAGTVHFGQGCFRVQGGVVSVSIVRRLLAVVLLVAAGTVIVVNPARAVGEDNEISRKVKSKVSPTYPDIEVGS